MIKWDKAFIINLDCDKDKWRPLSKFTELERFPALDSREQPFMYRDYGFELAPSTDLYRYMNEYFSQSKGAVGCYFSHYTIWKEMVEKKYNWCLVLEDDVCDKSLELFLNKGFNLLFEQQAEEEYDFYCLNKRAFNKDRTMKGTEAYLISQKAAKILIEESNNIITEPVDNYIGKIGAKQKKFKFERIPCIALVKESKRWENSSVTQHVPFWVMDIEKYGKKTREAEEKGAEWVRAQDFYKWWEKNDD